MSAALNSQVNSVTAAGPTPVSVSNVTLRKYKDALEAQNAANMEASSTGGNVLPAVLFRQGQRQMIASAFPIPFVRTRLQVNHAAERGNVEQVRSATNRPVISDHVDTVKNYIKDNVGGRYILPPLTLNVRQPISVYVPDYNSPLLSAWIVLPPGARMEITDGGHRKAAIDKVMKELNEDLQAAFEADAIAVMITVEADLDQIHQDFADCSKTRPLPKSQLAAFDRRNPANGLVIDIIGRCRLFQGKIDSTSKTLSKNSTNLFLTNQVRQMIKELLTGDYAMADEGFEEKAKQLLVSSDDPRYEATRDKFVAFIDRVTAAIPVLREIAAIPDGLQRNKIMDRRNEGYVCLSATGLVVIGRIGYELFKEGVEDWETTTDKLGEIDWNRSADIWQGNIIQNDRLLTQRGPVRGAVQEVKKAIGLMADVDETPA
jgi:DNA sulfur modification protein DndB